MSAEDAPLQLVIRSVAGECLADIPDASRAWTRNNVVEKLPEPLKDHKYDLVCGEATWAENVPLSSVLPQGEVATYSITAVVVNAMLQEEKDLALIAAAKNADMEKVEQLLAAGASAAFVHNPPGTWGAEDKKSALHMAIEASRHVRHDAPQEEKTRLRERSGKVIELLLAARADVNATRSQSDWRGCGSSSSAFEMILPQATEDTTLLKMFLDAGADPNKESVQNVSSMRTSGKASKAVLHTAVSGSKFEMAKILLDARANVDAWKKERFNNERGHNRHLKATSLHIACKSGNLALAALLLERGAEVNAVREDLEHEHVEVTNPDNDDPRSEDYECPVRCVPVRETALHLAIKSKSQDLVQLLVCLGADTKRERVRGQVNTSVEELCQADPASEETLIQALRQPEWSPELRALFAEAQGAMDARVAKVLDPK